MLNDAQKIQNFVEEIQAKFGGALDDIENTLTVFCLVAATKAKKMGLPATPARVLEASVNSTGVMRETMQKCVGEGFYEAKALKESPEYFEALIDFIDELGESMFEKRGSA